MTIRARAEEHAREDRVFADPMAADWYARLTWPSEFDNWYSPDLQSALAFRADNIDHIIRRCASSTSSASITELGCGLSTRRARLADLAPASWVDVDLPGIIALRRSWGVTDDSQLQVASSVFDYDWMNDITGDPAAQIFVAEGLLYYLPRESVDRLFAELRRRFAGSVVIFDIIGANDFPRSLGFSTEIGTPMQWMLERDYADALEEFGLHEVSGFEPDALMDVMLKRYWRRFGGAMQAGIYWARSVKSVWAGRSGTVMGRLPPTP